jgi:hypothetical protein
MSEANDNIDEQEPIIKQVVKPSRFPYQTVEQVRNIYYSQNFMPQKNESKDVPFLMKMSGGFNPIVSFDVTSMEHSGSAFTSSYHEYSYRNGSQGSGGNFAFVQRSIDLNAVLE